MNQIELLAALPAAIEIAPQDIYFSTEVKQIMLTPALAEQWKKPELQRPLYENAKVQEVATGLRVARDVFKRIPQIPGVIHLGVLDKITYRLDGQNRMRAFTISGCQEAIVDLRICYFETEAAMGLEFIHLNDRLSRFYPDDALRALTPGSLGLQLVRSRCPFVNYTKVRRNSTSSTILSMSTTIRCWLGSALVAPTHNGVRERGVAMAQSLTPEVAGEMIGFLEHAEAAWGRDEAYGRLWSTLNLVLCMWLYRKLILKQHARGLTASDFRRCLMSLSADANYVDWLGGRVTMNRDRSPCYARIKHIFARRLASEGKDVKWPGATWR